MPFQPRFGSDVPFWLDRPTDPPEPPFAGQGKADIVIVGGGFSGLWTAIQLKDSAPTADVVLLEQAVVGYGASGRNGGIIEASLTHGLANGLRHFPDEIDILQAEGSRNYHELVAFIRREGIDCDLEETGSLTLATAPWQADGLDEWAADLGRSRRAGRGALFVAGTCRDRLPHRRRRSAAAAGSRRDRRPRQARAWPQARRAGARRAHPRGHARHPPRAHRFGRPRARGGRVGVGVRRLGASGRRASGARSAMPWGPAVARESGAIHAKRVVVATSAYSGWFRRLSTWFVPVYDYVLVSEPLTPEQKAAVGWSGRQGGGDASNRFHYFRLTADDRILWGGYDAIYQGFSRVAPKFDARPATFDLLDRQFREFLPQLDDLRWTHRWGGAIDVTSNFTVTFGKTMGGRDPLRAGLYRARRRGLTLGGRRRARHARRARCGRAQDALRARQALAHPARAVALRGRGRAPARVRPRRRPTRAARASSCAPWSRWASASTRRQRRPSTDASLGSQCPLGAACGCAWRTGTLSSPTARAGGRSARPGRPCGRRPR